ncbi:MAG: LysR family transcriptional regulator [Beijerinckiaceae bacterium]
MSAPRLSWDDFRLIKTIAEARTLAGAATTLGVNPSTVFRRLGEAEEKLGVPLFERHRTGYVPTAAGEEMAALADSFDANATAFALRLAGREVKPSGELRITTSESFLAYLLTPVLSDFRKAYPEIRLDVVVTNQSLNLSKRDADVAIRPTDTPPENLVGRRICGMGWAIYTRRDTAVTDLQMALAEAPWVTLGDSFLHIQAAKYVRAHVPPERIAYKVNSVLGLCEAVESGAGVGPLPCFQADTRPDLVRITDTVPEFNSSLWLLTHPELRQSPRVRAFMDFGADALAKLRHRIEGSRPRKA